MADKRSFSSYETTAEPAPSPSDIMIFCSNGNVGFTFEEAVELQRQGGYTSIPVPVSAGDGYAVVMPIAGSFTIANWNVATAPVGFDMSIALYLNNVLTAMVVTITDGTVVGVQTGGPIAVVPNDIVTWFFSTNTGDSYFGNSNIYLVFEPS